MLNAKGGVLKLKCKGGWVWQEKRKEIKTLVGWYIYINKYDRAPVRWEYMHVCSRKVNNVTTVIPSGGSDSQRPLTDTLGFSAETHALPAFNMQGEKHALAHVSLVGANISNTNQTKPVMTPQTLKIICAAHFGWRSVFSTHTQFTQGSH